jgi:hypothetical protein
MLYGAIGQGLWGIDRTLGQPSWGDRSWLVGLSQGLWDPEVNDGKGLIYMEIIES